MVIPNRYPKPLISKHCKTCGKPFDGDGRTVYCGEGCRKENVERRYRKLNPRSTLPSSTVGAIGELLVCTDLLRRGYEVFRSVSPNCSCDLAVLKNGTLLRIEVRTGHRAANGKIYWPIKKSDQEKSDHFAVVTDGEIEYHPDLSDLRG